jgi:ABC-type glutathione transport system ATPase component
MVAAILGLSWGQLLGILGSAGSGLSGVIAAVYAVRRAKQETRAQVEHECLERIERLHLAAPDE